MAARTEDTKPKPKTIFDLLAEPRVQKGLTDVASRYLNPERLLRLCVNAVKKTPKLARCDTGSLLGSMMTSAALGLEPNTVTQQAFLIPYDNRRLIDGTWQTVHRMPVPDRLSRLDHTRRSRWVSPPPGAGHPRG